MNPEEGQGDRRHDPRYAARCEAEKFPKFSLRLPQFATFQASGRAMFWTHK